MKLESSSVKRSVLAEMLFYVTAVDYREESLCASIYKVFQQKSRIWLFEGMLIDLSCCVKCESITGSSRKENYLCLEVFAMSQLTNLKSVLWGQ